MSAGASTSAIVIQDYAVEFAEQKSSDDSLVIIVKKKGGEDFATIE